MKAKNNDGTSADVGSLRDLILGMRAAFARGENAMEFARRAPGSTRNSTTATLIAYDLQAGSYVASARAAVAETERWCLQLAQTLSPYLTTPSSILEVGCGEATTLAGVVRNLPVAPRYTLGFDISWSRCAQGLEWLREQQVPATLFVADLFDIPLEDDSVDVIYTSHSLEPNGGREVAALRELLRVARSAVLLFEPIYELADEQSQARMRKHGYVRGLKEAAEALSAKVVDFRLLDFLPTPYNPSGVIAIEKSASGAVSGAAGIEGPAWRCPLTHTPVTDAGDAYIAKQAGLAYPVLRQVPLLRAEHGIVASGLAR